MDESTKIEVATIVLWNFFAIIVHVIAFVIMYMKANRNASLKAFSFVELCMLIWLLGKVFKTVAPTVELRWIFIVFYYLGICLLEASFLEFSYICYYNKPLKRPFRIVIYAIALIQFGIVATNPLHHLFYSVYGFWGDDFGILFYVHVAINYAFILIGMVFAGRRFNKQLTEKSRFKKNIIALAILLPLVFNFIYITRVLEALFNILHLQIFDITPIVYTWSILVFVYATFKYEFFELTPIMKHEITQKLNTPVLILDHNREILLKNKQYDDDFPDDETVTDRLNLEDNNDKIIQYNQQFYKYYVSRYGGDKFIIGFADITAYEQAKAELDGENKELDEANAKLEKQIEMLKRSSRAGAGNYIARELHDILGHSLVVTIKLLEVSKLFYDRDRGRTCESLEKAREALENGFIEIKDIKNTDSGRTYNTYTLEKELKSMLKVLEIGGIAVRFFIRGKSMDLDEKIYDTLRKIITELVTNTLKHSNADRLLLSINIDDNKIILQTMDNGKGAANLVKGNGLQGIDGRLALVSGRAKYTADDNEGFSSSIFIPL